MKVHYCWCNEITFHRKQVGLAMSFIVGDSWWHLKQRRLNAIDAVRRSSATADVSRDVKISSTAAQL